MMQESQNEQHEPPRRSRRRARRRPRRGTHKRTNTPGDINWGELGVPKQSPTWRTSSTSPS